MPKRSPLSPQTAPDLPADEAPLDAATLDALLVAMGRDMVLVGGQALAFWMDRYGLEPETATITNDGDLLGGLAPAAGLARALRGALVQPQERALTALVAQIRIPIGGDARVRNIDVLHLLYTVSGLRRSRDFTKAVWRDSIEIEWKPRHTIRVMHPLHVLDSRIQNAAGLLDEKGPHVLTQAAWAIQVARAAILRVIDQPEEDDRLGHMIQKVYTLARSRAGRQLQREHGLEVLHAIPIDEIRVAAPHHERQLAAVQRAIENRDRHG